jgi:drug/metabolite transporter (DMT)-like permease
VTNSPSREIKPHPLAFAALLAGNVALSFGPWLVRLADTGPVAAGFWRLALAIPFLWLLALLVGQRLIWPRRALLVTLAIATFLYAADLAAWNAGIRLTKLGNATLFGNIGSFVFAAWGLWLLRLWPSRVQSTALILAAAGCVLLMVGSYELSARHLRGDLLAILAGLLYAGYLIGVERARGELEPLPLLLLVTVLGAAMLLPFSAALGERIIPGDWTPLLIFALSSQVIGQGLLVYAIGTLPPFVIGLALLTQPAISALIGWLAYREALSPLDWVGAVAIGVALVLVRLPERGLRAAEARPT